MEKKRIIKDYNQMPPEILVQLKNQYPHGYQEYVLRFNNAKGELISALPFETDEIFYLVKIDTSGGYHIVDEEDLVDDLDALSEADELEFDETEE